VRVIALGLTISSTAAGTAMAQAPAEAPLPMRLTDATLPFGKPAVATGKLSSTNAGRTVALEFRTVKGGWSEIARAVVGRDGRYRVVARAPLSGRVRVALVAPSGGAQASTAPAVSSERRVAVLARVGVERRRVHVKVGSSALVAGRVAPYVAGRLVSLQGRVRGRWVTLDRTRTRAGGTFSLTDRQTRAASTAVRVNAGGTRGIGVANRNIGRLNAYRFAHASWYGPGLFGNKLGCGGRLNGGTLGVAHKSLPCGTKVTLRHRGRSIRVAVIDRGPYVGNREFDLTQATAQRLGFTGHGPLLVTR
jgi:hypothetical protein